jgi:hypothetical protein
VRAVSVLLGVLLTASAAQAQPVPDGLPSKFNTHTERQENQSCTGASKSCVDWCDKNNPVSNSCKQECTWRVDYCKRTGLYPSETRRSVWVGNRD